MWPLSPAASGAPPGRSKTRRREPRASRAAHVRRQRAGRAHRHVAGVGGPGALPLRPLGRQRWVSTSLRVNRGKYVHRYHQNRMIFPKSDDISNISLCIQQEYCSFPSGALGDVLMCFTRPIAISFICPGALLVFC